MADQTRSERIGAYLDKVLNRAEDEITSGAYATEVQQLTEALFYAQQMESAPQPTQIVFQDGAVITGIGDLLNLRDALYGAGMMESPLCGRVEAALASMQLAASEAPGQQ